MQTGLSDTSAAAERVQLELLRQAGPQRRLQLALDMSHFAVEAAYAALRSRYPQMSEREIGILFVEHSYGAALAAGVRAALAVRDSDHGPVS
jgi:hypothetical protein